MLTVLCWLWQPGRRDYRSKHVNALGRMLAKHCEDYRLVCVTNAPKGIECETFPLWDFPQIEHRKGWDAYRRLKLFDPECGEQFGERVLSLDLDVIVEGDILSLVDTSKDFQAMEGTTSYLNGSMWYLKTGTHRDIWDSFDCEQSPKLIEQAKIVGSDQGWLSLKLPGASLWKSSDGVWSWKRMLMEHSYRTEAELPRNRKLVTFPGIIKPWSEECRVRTPELFEIYMDYL